MIDPHPYQSCCQLHTIEFVLEQRNLIFICYAVSPSHPNYHHHVQSNPKCSLKGTEQTTVQDCNSGIMTDEGTCRHYGGVTRTQARCYVDGPPSRGLAPGWWWDSPGMVPRETLTTVWDPQTPRVGPRMGPPHLWDPLLRPTFNVCLPGRPELAGELEHLQNSCITITLQITY